MEHSSERNEGGRKGRKLASSERNGGEGKNHTNVHVMLISMMDCTVAMMVFVLDEMIQRSCIRTFLCEKFIEERRERVSCRTSPTGCGKSPET